MVSCAPVGKRRVTNPLQVVNLPVSGGASDITIITEHASLAGRAEHSPRAVQTPGFQDVLPPKTYGAVVQHLRAGSHFRIDGERVARGVLHLQCHRFRNGVWLDRADLCYTAPRRLPDGVACGGGG